MQLTVRVMDSRSGEPRYERVGPDSPLWHERMAEIAAEKARAGDTEAAREILSDFVAAIDRWSARAWRGPVSWAYARYIADAFQQIVDGKDASQSTPPSSTANFPVPAS